MLAMLVKNFNFQESSLINTLNAHELQSERCSKLKKHHNSPQVQLDTKLHNHQRKKNNELSDHFYFREIKPSNLKYESIEQMSTMNRCL